MDLDAAYALVLEMQRHPGPAADRFATFGTREARFKEDFPHLFAMACEDGMDTEMLRIMISEMKKGADERCAKVVGHALGDRYVTPLVEGGAKGAPVRREAAPDVS